MGTTVENNDGLTIQDGDQITYDAAGGIISVNGRPYSGSDTMATLNTANTITGNNITGNITSNINSGAYTTISTGGSYSITNATTPWSPYNNGTWTNPITPNYGAGGITWTPNTNGWSIMDSLPPSTDEIATPTAIYPTPINVANVLHRHHYMVWKGLNPDVPYKLITVHADETSHNAVRQLCFFDEASHTKFSEWWKEYAARFDGNPLDQLYPLPKSSGSVFVVKSAIDPSEQWHWIVESCRGGVAYGGGFWFFDSEGDKTKFQLKWAE